MNYVITVGIVLFLLGLFQKVLGNANKHRTDNAGESVAAFGTVWFTIGAILLVGCLIFWLGTRHQGGY